MKKSDIAKSIIKNNGGIAKTAQLNEVGIQNSEIKKMCESGEIERVKHGYYQVANHMEISEEKMISVFLEEGVVCMESALFYYGYSDKTPLVWTIAVPRKISRTKIKIDNFPCKVYYVQEDKLAIGKTEGIFNGIELPVYDRERTICDCFKHKSKMDNEMFNKAINAYVADNNKNLSNLSKYAKEMRVYKKVTELMEVMLNG
ncbi:MAG: abortive phage infection protein [Lachnospiraceae bacterium]|nr:abortive phage infection protein [Lachnospiraceae bacterium]